MWIIHTRLTFCLHLQHVGNYSVYGRIGMRTDQDSNKPAVTNIYVHLDARLTYFREKSCMPEDLTTFYIQP